MFGSAGGLGLRLHQAGLGEGPAPRRVLEHFAEDPHLTLGVNRKSIFWCLPAGPGTGLLKPV